MEKNVAKDVNLETKQVDVIAVETAHSSSLSDAVSIFYDNKYLLIIVVFFLIDIPRVQMNLH